jgi:ABC-type Fe3+-siderophore transport system permease subunit
MLRLATRLRRERLLPAAALGGYLLLTLCDLFVEPGIEDKSSSFGLLLLLAIALTSTAGNPAGETESPAIVESGRG